MGVTIPGSLLEVLTGSPSPVQACGHTGLPSADPCFHSGPPLLCRSVSGLASSRAAKADRLCIQLEHCPVLPWGHQTLFLDYGHA